MEEQEFDPRSVAFDCFESGSFSSQLNHFSRIYIGVSLGTLDCFVRAFKTRGRGVHLSDRGRVLFGLGKEVEGASNRRKDKQAKEGFDYKHLIFSNYTRIFYLNVLKKI